MRFGVAYTLISFLFTLAGCTSAPATNPSPYSDEPSATPVGDYKIAPGDVIDITVFGHNDLSGQYTVDAEGNISMPLVSMVSTNGMSTSDLEVRLVEMLRPDYLRNPDVSVKLVSYIPIYVLGEVQNAGSYPYQPNMSVLNAVALAGGYTYRASRKKLIVVRGDDESRQETNVSESATLRPGDTLIVRQRLF